MIALWGSQSGEEEDHIDTNYIEGCVRKENV